MSEFIGWKLYFNKTIKIKIQKQGLIRTDSPEVKTTVLFLTSPTPCMVEQCGNKSRLNRSQRPSKQLF